MKKLIKAGATSQTIDIFIQDSTSTTGAGKTGLVYNTASLTAYYRKGATGTATAITLATQTVGGAYSSGGFVEIDSTNMPGMYRLDLPNAVVDTAGSASLMLKGATGMAPCTIELQMGTFDFEAGAVQTGDSYAIVNHVTYGNAAINTKLGTPAYTSVSDDIAHVHTDTTSISGRIPAALSGGKMDSVVAAADIAAAVWNAATATYGSAGSYGLLVETNLDAAITTRSVAGDAMALTAGERNSTADAFLNRDMSTGTDSGSPTVRTVRQALRALRNKWTNSAGTYTVYKEDDTTASWSSTLTTDAAANPITSSDPA